MARRGPFLVAATLAVGVLLTAPAAAIMVAVPTSNTMRMWGCSFARNAAMPAFSVSE